jgi:hypothetical protein
MTDTRDAFERHFQLSQRQAKRDNSGEYIDEFVRARWEGWQAAMAVKLPEIDGIPKEAMQAANALLFDMIGKPEWDLPCAAKHIMAYADKQECA